MSSSIPEPTKSESSATYPVGPNGKTLTIRRTADDRRVFLHDPVTRFTIEIHCTEQYDLLNLLHGLEDGQL